MRFIEDLCPPALLYLIFLAVQLGLDASLGMWVTLVIKTFLGLATVVVLDTLCGVELSAVSWFLVAAPFIITALATAIAMGSNFDVTVMQQLNLKEKFEQKDDTVDDVPVGKSSNSVERQVQNGTMWGRK
jgi:dolichyl-phosphate-mannose--protein O-mannosyl transferase